MDSPKGAVAVTGTSTGIGAAFALHLDTLGFRVFVGVRKAANGQALKRRASGALTPLLLDVTDEASKFAMEALTDALRLS